MSKLLEAHTRPLVKYLKRKDIVEICINKPGKVCLELDSGDWEFHNEKDITLRGMLDFAKALATASGQEFNPEIPILSAHIPGFGSRIQIMGESLVDSGIAISIRVALAARFPLEHYFPGEPERAAFLRQAIRDGWKILVVGGTGSGKTTLLNSMIAEIPSSIRIISVEDVKELVVDHRNSVRVIKSRMGLGLVKIGWKEVINSLMRMNPKYLLLGEFAPQNTIPFLRLLHSGHPGMATLHSNEGASSWIAALSLNANMAGNGSISFETVSELALKSVDLVIHIKNRSKIELMEVGKL